MISEYSAYTIGLVYTLLHRDFTALAGVYY